MSQENFWNNREKAQALIDEANTLRKKTEPILKAERQIDDFRVMLELAQEEPVSAQAKHELNARTQERRKCQFSLFTLSSFVLVPSRFDT